MPQAIIPGVRDFANADPTALALQSAGDVTLSRGELVQAIDALDASFRKCDVGKHDAVAVVVADNLGFGLQFLAAVNADFCVVPFNALTPPATVAAQAARAGCSYVVVPKDWKGRDAAAELFAQHGIGVIIQSPDEQTGFGFSLSRETESGADRTVVDASLMLRTSGTTGEPKLVALNAAHLEDSARDVIESLALTENDRGICLMPLLHVHGLVACFLAPLLTGSAMKVLNHMDVATLAEDLESNELTWFSAVPTVHMTLMSRFAEHLSDNAGKSLRFVRSASAPLSEPVREFFEQRLGTEVLEAYGMTEAAHQIASQSFSERAPAGSVGKVSTDKVQLIGDNGLTNRGTGEVALNLGDYFSGYLAGGSDDNFHDGWFRTGDVGEIDENGFLSLVGRIKEMINRGGETIAPRDVETAALTCTGIDSACAFAIPHETFGETVALAVTVGTDGPDEKALRRAMFSQLAPPLMPALILFMEELPTGATGKIDRRALTQMVADAD